MTTKSCVVTHRKKVFDLEVVYDYLVTQRSAEGRCPDCGGKMVIHTLFLKDMRVYHIRDRSGFDKNYAFPDIPLDSRLGKELIPKILVALLEDYKSDMEELEAPMCIISGCDQCPWGDTAEQAYETLRNEEAVDDLSVHF